MRRREFIAGLGGAAAWPLVGGVAQSSVVPKIEPGVDQGEAAARTAGNLRAPASRCPAGQDRRPNRTAPPRLILEGALSKRLSI
jgi:hypothetical protein